MISVRDVSKTFETPESVVHALNGVSLEVEDGEIYGVVGQSGAGKSTLIRTINLLEKPTSGEVFVDGINVTALVGNDLRSMRNQIGMIFQHFNLLSSRTALKNVELPLELTGMSAGARRKRAHEILDLVGLSTKAQAYPSQLSGGQKQRVGIARALAARPKVLLSDEATSALDPETTTSILGLLKDINRELGLTVLLITHEMDVVKRICDSAALMESGRVVEHGKINQLIQTPGSKIASSLFPLGDGEIATGNTVADITFAGMNSHDPVISQLIRGFQIEVGILGAAIESIAGTQVGRLRVELIGHDDQVRLALASLRSQGLFVEVHGADRDA